MKEPMYSIAQAATLMRYDRLCLAKALAKLNIKPDKKGLYKLSDCEAARFAAMSRDNRFKPSEIGDLKKLKIKLECARMDVELKKSKGLLIPVEEYLQELTEYALIVNSVFDRWLSNVKALTGDAVLVKQAEELRVSARKELEEGCRKLEEKGLSQQPDSHQI